LSRRAPVQHLIPHRVPQCVVDFLEIVEIDEKNGDVRVVPLGHGDGVC
jgi:hypothetical protein